MSATRVEESPAPANPLQLGQRVYEVSEAAILATPKGATAGTFNRVTFSRPAEGPGVQLGVADPLQLEPLSSYAEIRAAHDPVSGADVLYGLQQPGGGAVAIDRIASSSGGVAHETLTPAFAAAQRIAGILPAPPGAVPQPGGSMPVGPLLSAGFDGTSVTLSTCDSASGAGGRSWTVPVATPGNVLAAELVRRQRDAWVVLLLEAGGQLLACGLDTAALAASTIPKSAVSSVKVGALAASPTVSTTPAQVLATTSDQQLAVVYGDSAKAMQLALVGFGDSGMTSLATTAVDTSLGKPEQALWSVAAADLNADGVDEIVVGYPVTYGKVAGCAALVLYEYTAATTQTGAALTSKSTYAACAPEEQPLTSIDLHLAAGMFGADSAGTTLVEGVLVLGCGASIGDVFKGQAEVMGGVVAVDPSTSQFPPLVGGQPATLPFVATLAEVDHRSERFLGIAADLTGLSVTLGSPTFTQVEGESQILAILLAPPFDAQAARATPSLSFTKVGSTVEGYNVSSNKMYMTSTDAGMNIGVGGQTIGRHVANNYGKNFDKNTDATTTTGVTETITLSVVDMLLVYATDYWVWEYPVFRPAVSPNQDGTLLVVFPSTPSPIQSGVPAYELDYGYVQPFENGNLPSYAGLSHDGYDGSADDCLLFYLYQLPVTQDPVGSSTITYDETKANTQSLNVGYTIHNTTTDSAHIAAQTSLFDFLPLSFGMNLSSTESYSDTEMQTTMLSRTDSLVITVTGGSVSDPAYDYEVTPYIYQHQKLGCTVIGYDVALTGDGWSELYSRPYPMLVRPYRTSVDKVLSGLSRSIGFVTDPQTGAVTIGVTVFNAGYAEVDTVTCTAWQGLPTVSGGTLAPPSGASIGSATASDLAALGRTTVQIPWPGAAERQTVTVMVSGGARPPIPALAEVAWNAYPPAYAAEVPT